MKMTAKEAAGKLYLYVLCSYFGSRTVALKLCAVAKGEDEEEANWDNTTLPQMSTNMLTIFFYHGHQLSFLD